jgi:folate-binding protein YgfZ
MSDRSITVLPDRAIIELHGPDTTKFLQGLLTNDIDRARPGEAIFAGLLTTKGKIICDFLVYGIDPETIFMDCPRDHAGDLVKRFTLYKLRARVNISDRSDELIVGACWGANPEDPPEPLVVQVNDPRYALLGRRFIIERSSTLASTLVPVAADGEAAYHRHRIALAVPQIGLDYAFGEAFPHEACYDALNGVDFKKGCYVGQEIVSRMHHKGTPKTRIAAASGNGRLVPGMQILAGDHLVGQVGSSDGWNAIAMVRLDRVREAAAAHVPLRAADVEVTLRRPAWANYDVPNGDGRE